MANYHLEIKPISRKRGTSVTKRTHYITGHKLHDSYRQKSYYRNRNDVLYSTIFQPDWAPSEFHDLQQLCDQIEAAELRRDARTGREFIGSLPNELPLNELVTIVCDFVESSFLKYSLCAIAAIHEGKNARDPSRSNPHVHIIVPTRTVGPDGFCPKKDREHDKREYILIWREQWALVQNRAYEREKLDIRVSHESLEMQGIYDRKPRRHLSRINWQRTQQREHALHAEREMGPTHGRGPTRRREDVPDHEYGREFYLSR